MIENRHFRSSDDKMPYIPLDKACNHSLALNHDTKLARILLTSEIIDRNASFPLSL
jgi:hypothetical protein